MNQSLKVVLEADIKQMQSALTNAKKRLKDFEGNVQSANKPLGNLHKDSNRAAGAVGNLGRTTQVNAVPAMTSFSQVIQDAPYGIRGVANNITQLTSQMGYLAKSSGGVGGAMKALGSTLMGPAGILLAVSAVTSILVSYGDELFSTKTKTEELAEETEKAKDKVDEFIKSLNTLRQVDISINIEVQKELAKLDALRQQLENTDNSDKRRLSALNELRKQYPSILKNYKDETILANGLEQAYNDIAFSIRERARSGKALDQILKNEEQIVKVNEKQKDLLKELSQAQQTLNNRKRQLDDSLGSKTEAVAIGRYKKAQEAVDDLVGELEELASTRTKLSNQIIQLRSVVSVVTNDDEVESPNGKPTLKVKAEVSEIDDPFGGDYTMEGTLNGQFGGENDINGFQQHLRDQENAFDEHTEVMEEKMQEYNTAMNEEAMMLSSIFGQMSNQIIDGLLSGEMSVESFVKSSIKALGSLLVNMAQQAIAEKLIGKAQMATDQGVASGNAIVMASNAAAAMGPYGVLAYPGLLASQLAITNGAFGAIQAFNDGGMVGGGMATGDKVLARLNSGEMVLNQGQQRNLFRMLDGAHLGSGSEPLEIYGETVTRGDDLITVLRRTEKKNSRIN